MFPFQVWKNVHSAVRPVLRRSADTEYDERITRDDQELRAMRDVRIHSHEKYDFVGFSVADSTNNVYLGLAWGYFTWK